MAVKIWPIQPISAAGTRLCPRAVRAEPEPDPRPARSEFPRPPVCFPGHGNFVPGIKIPFPFRRIPPDPEQYRVSPKPDPVSDPAEHYFYKIFYIFLKKFKKSYLSKYCP